MRQEYPTRVDEVDARQAILHRHFLRPHVLLYGHREVRPTLDRRVVGDNQHLAAVHASYSRHHPRPRSLVVVHAVRRQRRELDERRSGVEQTLQSVANQEFASLHVPLAMRGRSPFRRAFEPLAELRNELEHLRPVGLELVARRVYRTLDSIHRTVPSPIAFLASGRALSAQASTSGARTCIRSRESRPLLLHGSAGIPP